jgi:hypothetical protein
MARKATSKINEKRLGKGDLRKLTALRKSLGDKIADAAFVQWMAERPEEFPRETRICGR